MFSFKYQCFFQQIYRNSKICNNKYANISYFRTTEKTKPSPEDVKMQVIFSPPMNLKNKNRLYEYHII